MSLFIAPTTTPEQQKLRMDQRAAALEADRFGSRNSHAWRREYRRILDGGSPALTYRPFAGLTYAAS